MQTHLDRISSRDVVRMTGYHREMQKFYKMALKVNYDRVVVSQGLICPNLKILTKTQLHMSNIHDKPSVSYLFGYIKLCAWSISTFDKTRHSAQSYTNQDPVVVRGILQLAGMHVKHIACIQDAQYSIEVNEVATVSQ